MMYSRSKEVLMVWLAYQRHCLRLTYTKLNLTTSLVRGLNVQKKVLIINQLDALIPQIYFCNKTLNFSNSSSVHHQEFFTVHTEIVYVIRLC